jgi:hypothetical protein
MVKLAKAKDPKSVTANVTKTYDQVQAYPTNVILDDGEQTMRNIDVSTTILVVDNNIDLGTIPY